MATTTSGERLRCFSCNVSFQLPPSLSSPGSLVPCPRCGAANRVPSSDEVVLALVASSEGDVDVLRVPSAGHNTSAEAQVGVQASQARQISS